MNSCSNGVYIGQGCHILATRMKGQEKSIVYNKKCPASLFVENIFQISNFYTMRVKQKFS